MTPSVFSEIQTFEETHPDTFRLFLAQLQMTDRTLYDASIKLTIPYKGDETIVEEDQPKQH